MSIKFFKISIHQKNSGINSYQSIAGWMPLFLVAIKAISATTIS